jgi:hypothetical protein
MVDIKHLLVAVLSSLVYICQVEVGKDALMKSLVNGVQLACLLFFVYYVLCESQMFHARCCRLRINHYSCVSPQRHISGRVHMCQDTSVYDAFWPSGCAGELVPNRGIGVPNAPIGGLL